MNKIEKLTEWLSNNKKSVAGAAALAISGAVLFLLTRESGQDYKPIGDPTDNGESDEKVKKSQKNNHNQAASVSAADTPYILKARQIAKKIHVEQLGSTYDLNTISQVLEQSIELAEEDFVEVTLKNRTERRQFMQNDIAGYERLVVEYNDEVENVLKKAQQQILEILSIPYEDFEESVIDFMEKGHYQEIYMFQAAIRQKIKEKIQATKDLTIDQTKEIIRFQIEILNQQPELLKQLVQKLSSSPETVQLIPIIITNLLNDYIYNQFHVEEEDQMKVFSRPDLGSDPEIIMLLQEIEQSMFQLMVPYGVGMGGY